MTENYHTFTNSLSVNNFNIETSLNLHLEVYCVKIQHSYPLIELHNFITTLTAGIKRLKCTVECLQLDFPVRSLRVSAANGRSE